MPTPSKGVRNRNRLTRQRMLLMHDQGCGYGQIAKTLNRSKSSIIRLVHAALRDAGRPPPPWEFARECYRARRHHMMADRERGLTFGQIALKYHSDPSTVRKSILCARSEVYSEQAQT